MAQLVILYLERQLAAMAPSRSLASWGRLAAPQLRVSSKEVVPHVSVIGRFLRMNGLIGYLVESAHFAIRSPSACPHARPSLPVGQLGQGPRSPGKRGRQGRALHRITIEGGLQRMVSSHRLTSLTGRSSWAWQEKRYLVSREPGSIVSFDFTIPMQLNHGSAKRNGRVLIGYQRSFGYGLGSVDCWVDDGARKRIDGWWDIKERNMGVYVTFLRNDHRSPHSVSNRSRPTSRQARTS